MYHHGLLVIVGLMFLQARTALSQAGPCDTEPCENGALCENTLAGGFQCYCVDGYTGETCSVNFDECASAPCRHRGQCIDAVAGYTCICPPEYTGHDCEIDVDDCVSNACAYNGSCIDLVGGFICLCPSPYRGDNCSTLPCDVSACENGAKCINDVTFNVSTSGYVCQCPAGFTGTRCEKSQQDCDVTACSGNGLCVDGDGTFTCFCQPGWIGQFCQLPVDDCQENSCKNNASCTDIHLGYECACAAGYEGALCERERDECGAWTPCKNGATCVDLFNGYRCECTAGWMGTNCTDPIDQCDVSSCLNGGQCLEVSGGFQCRCPPFYTGTICQTLYNPCAPEYNPCENGANCITPPDGQYICFCAKGFTGVNCEININECLSFPCKNNATCEDITSGYQCHCTPGWEGDNCESNVDDCASGPCLNNSTCTDHHIGFECNCTSAYEGRQCEDVVDFCLQQPCANGATCIGQLGGYQCICPYPYTGPTCLDLIDSCASDPCFNNGTCSNTLDGFQCTCVLPYTGQTCGNLTNFCESEPCFNEATCTSLRSGFVCTCPPFLTGRQCTELADYCEDEPCHNDGFCINGLYNFRCICAYGFTGSTCDTMVNFCAENPCQNAANCTNIPGGFTCDCLPYYTGELCQSVLPTVTSSSTKLTPSSSLQMSSHTEITPTPSSSIVHSSLTYLSSVEHTLPTISISPSTSSIVSDMSTTESLNIPSPSIPTSSKFTNLQSSEIGTMFRSFDTIVSLSTSLSSRNAFSSLPNSLTQYLSPLESKYAFQSSEMPPSVLTDILSPEQTNMLTSSTVSTSFKLDSLSVHQTVQSSSIYLPLIDTSEFTHTSFAQTNDLSKGTMSVTITSDTNFITSKNIVSTTDLTQLIDSSISQTSRFRSTHSLFITHVSVSSPISVEDHSTITTQYDSSASTSSGLYLESSYSKFPNKSEGSMMSSLDTSSGIISTSAMHNKSYGITLTISDTLSSLQHASSPFIAPSYSDTNPSTMLSDTNKASTFATIELTSSVPTCITQTSGTHQSSFVIMNTDTSIAQTYLPSHSTKDYSLDSSTTIQSFLRTERYLSSLSTFDATLTSNIDDFTTSIYTNQRFEDIYSTSASMSDFTTATSDTLVSSKFMTSSEDISSKSLSKMESVIPSQQTDSSYSEISSISPVTSTNVDSILTLMSSEQISTSYHFTDASTTSPGLMSDSSTMLTLTPGLPDIPTLIISSSHISSILQNSSSSDVENFFITISTSRLTTDTVSIDTFLTETSLNRSTIKVTDFDSSSTELVTIDSSEMHLMSSLLLPSPTIKTSIQDKTLIPTDMPSSSLSLSYTDSPKLSYMTTHYISLHNSVILKSLGSKSPTNVGATASATSTLYPGSEATGSELSTSLGKTLSMMDTETTRTSTSTRFSSSLATSIVDIVSTSIEVESLISIAPSLSSTQTAVIPTTRSSYDTSELFVTGLDSFQTSPTDSEVHTSMVEISSYIMETPTHSSLGVYQLSNTMVTSSLLSTASVPETTTTSSAVPMLSTSSTSTTIEPSSPTTTLITATTKTTSATTTDAPTSPCESFVCVNGGICRKDGMGSYCDCLNGYVGTSCETRTSVCDGYVCENGGVCLVTWGQFGVYTPRCDCPLPFSGARCDIEKLIYFPSFNGASYLQLLPLSISAGEMNEIYISVKTTQTIGTILYSSSNNKHALLNGNSDAIDDPLALSLHNGNTDVDEPITDNQRSHDNKQQTSLATGETSEREALAYVWLYLVEGRLQYRFSCDGLVEETIKTNVYIATGDLHDLLIRQTWTSGAGQWCSAAVSVNGRTFVASPILSRGDSRSLQSLFIGGYPRYTGDSIIHILDGFIGCVKSLQINDQELDLVVMATSSRNIYNCNVPVCLHSPCRNGATCHSSGEEWYCNCPRGYGGTLCDRKLCDVSACHHGGTCVILDDVNDQLCICPYGTAGVLCEKEVQVDVPHFHGNQYGYSSYIAYDRPHYIVDDFELELHFIQDDVQQNNSFLLFIGNTGSSTGRADFVVLGIEQHYVVFRFDLGSGYGQMYSQYRLDTSISHHVIRCGRTGRSGWLQVDAQRRVTGKSRGHLTALNTNSPLYIGGVDATIGLLPDGANFDEGFKGCIFNVHIKSKDTVFMPPGNPPGHVTGGRNVIGCSSASCDVRPCRNGGTCLDVGASVFCNCPTDRYGVYCMEAITVCDGAHACSDGSTCVPAIPEGYQCMCPLGRKGQFCEQDLTISDPLFNGEDSYMSFVPVYIKKETNILLQVKPYRLSGLLFYASQHQHIIAGDFLAVSLNKGVVEMRFHLGDSLNVVKSDVKLKIDTWYTIEASRNATHTYISVDGQSHVVKVTGMMSYLDVTSDFHIGAIPNMNEMSQSAFSNKPSAFNGCIRELVVNEHRYELILDGAINGINVDDCDGTRCGYDVCKHSGTCTVRDNGAAYHCECPDNYYGDRCEVPIQCRNNSCVHGDCESKGEGYTCHCQLGWRGTFCDSETTLGTDIRMSKDSFLLLQDNGAYFNNKTTTRFSFDFKTPSTNGMMIWIGQTYSDDSDYLGLGVDQGKITLVWNLGWFSRGEVVTSLRYNDQTWHSIDVYRLGQTLTMIVDDTVYESRVSGDFYQLDIDGHLYLGGFREASVHQNTFGYYSTAFNGCLRDLKFNRSPSVQFNTVSDGRNVVPCG